MLLIVIILLAAFIVVPLAELTLKESALYFTKALIYALTLLAVGYLLATARAL